MAFYTQSLKSAPQQSVVSNLLSMLGRPLQRIFDAQNRSCEVSRLQGLSDAELTRLGLSRDTVVRYVYRDIYNV